MNAPHRPWRHHLGAKPRLSNFNSKETVFASLIRFLRSGAWVNVAVKTPMLATISGSAKRGEDQKVRKDRQECRGNKQLDYSLHNTGVIRNRFAGKGLAQQTNRDRLQRVISSH